MPLKTIGNNFDHKRHKLMCRTAASSSSSALGFDGASNPSATPSAPPSDRRSLDSAVGGDEEIQVIEESSSPRKPRKRPYTVDEHEPCPHPKGWKDHSRNLLFKDTLQEHMKNLAKTGVAVNQHQAIALRLKYIAEHVIRSLNEYGWAVVDNFLGKAHCRYTYREVEELYERGLFREGQLVEGKEPDPATSAKDIRSDKIYWFDSAECRAQDAVTIRLLVSMIDSVIVHFSKRIPPYSIGGRSRAMIACYPGSGTRYVKHVDNPIRDGRCITSIYYCNDDWLLSRDGGTLRLYPETSQVPMDIDPQADRLVFFWSDHRNPHEVLPVFRPRYAITIWYFDESEKKEALERQRAEDQKNASRPSTASERVHSLLNRAEINSAPIPEKPRTPPRPMAVPVRSAKPEMQWRPSARVVADDQASTSTRSLIDDEDELVEVVDAADEAERDGKFVPNFEV
ncbi:Oxoglutarate iron-dependent oxygenase domain containing protein [Aphelenchoides fujianensis]|nr:Oxoglutarate iron-dependent oxygenase domain containing protein [Aphelenchoides fujianensis]